MSKCYFLTFVYFDRKHQRSNAFSHLGIAVMEGEKDTKGKITNMKLCNCYGYYSHKTPDSNEPSIEFKLLKLFGNINFRLRHYYAECKQEEVTYLDMGFGLEGGPFIEIFEQEKNILEEKITTAQKNEETFFASADAKAAKQLALSGITDPKKRKLMEINLKILYREQHYVNELNSIDHYIKQHKIKNSEIDFHEAAYRRGEISLYRLKQEKLRIVKGIEFFEFTFNPNGRTCKTMGMELVLKSLLPENNNTSIRKLFLSNLFSDQYFTRSLPIARKENAKVIFHSLQKKYSKTDTNPAFPDRKWQDAETELAYFGNNRYMDLQGKIQVLCDIDHPELYCSLIENLMHLERLLNDFCDTTNNFACYTAYIAHTIESMIKNKNDIEDVIAIYHKALQALDTNNCFAQITKSIFNSTKAFKSPSDFSNAIIKHHIKLEDGVKEELHRLITMAKHAKVDNLYQFLLYPSTKSTFSFFRSELMRYASSTENMQPVAVARKCM